MTYRTTCYICPQATPLAVHGGSCAQRLADYCPTCGVHVTISDGAA